MTRHSIRVGTMWHHGGGHVCKGCLIVGTEHNQTPNSLHKGDFITLEGQTGGGAVAPTKAGVSAELVFKGKGGRSSVLG